MSVTTNDSSPSLPQCRPPRQQRLYLIKVLEMEKLSSEQNLKQNTRRRQAAELFESINVYYKAADCFYELKEYVRAGRETKRIKVDSVMAFFALKEKVLELYTFAKIMTPNPECATVDTPIVDALHTMHDGRFLHLPVVDRDGDVVAVVDVLHITHAAVATMSW